MNISVSLGHMLYEFSIDLLWNFQNQLTNLYQILYVSWVGWENGFLSIEISSKLWLSWQQKAPIDLF